MAETLGSSRHVAPLALGRLTGSLCRAQACCWTLSPPLVIPVGIFGGLSKLDPVILAAI